MLELSEQEARYLPVVYRYLTIRNRSEKEIHEYLVKKQLALEVIHHLIIFLKEKKFLDDEAFARSWIRSRARVRPKGKYLVTIELQQKGIDREIIEKVFAEENEEVPDEITQARTLIVRRMERLRGASKQELYQKVGAFLSRRGFSWEVTKKAIDSFLESCEEDSK
jgi:regulatory protein